MFFLMGAYCSLAIALTGETHFPGVLWSGNAEEGAGAEGCALKS